MHFSLIMGECRYPGKSTNEIITDLDELSPKTRDLTIKFLEKCEENGLAVRITETNRTQTKQDLLYR